MFFILLISTYYRFTKESIVVVPWLNTYDWLVCSCIYLENSSVIASFLTDYIPHLVFIKADAFYTKLSQDSWFVMQKMQAIGNQAWHAIETPRAVFYEALLDEISHI